VNSGYCPGPNDWVIAYGENVNLQNGGFIVQGNGGAATKATFNLLNGYVEFDVDVSNSQAGVNANLYAIAPSGLGPEGWYDNDNQYCDGAINDRPNCIELDWFESNGNCAGASTLHTVMGEGNTAPCTSWGCRAHWTYNGNTKFHMKVTYGGDGSQTVMVDGAVLGGFDPNPVAEDWAIIKGEQQSKGLLIYGSEWTGWVPEEWCGTAGCLECSSYSISNLQVHGTVVQGPEPTKCGGPDPVPVPIPVPVPVPAPVPVPVPSPSPGTCPGGSLAVCIAGCPSDSAVFQICVDECTTRCEVSCTGANDGASLLDCVSACPSTNYGACVDCCASKFPSQDILL